jgi:hypothetical protein
MAVEFEEYQESSDNGEFDWTLQEGSNSHKILAFLANLSRHTLGVMCYGTQPHLEKVDGRTLF